jgi:hypothetical protein
MLFFIQPLCPKPWHGPSRLRLNRLLLLLSLASSVWLALPAQAHDSWLVPADADSGLPTRAQPQALYLSLTTGNRYPRGEFAVAPTSVVQAACRGTQGATAPLRALQMQPRSLLLRARSEQPLQACWLELTAAMVEIEPRLVQVYFNEIRPNQAARDAWNALLASGLPWQESYRKFARIELNLPASAEPLQRAALRRPQGLGLEVVPVGAAPLWARQELLFQILRDGKPLPNQPVEAVSERNPLGIWQTSDAQGHLRYTLPFTGRWLLRATQLELPQPLVVPGKTTALPTWLSRFVTLEFEAREN